MHKIKLLFFDIDGVITDGKLLVDEDGREFKQMDYRDIDAIFKFKTKGIKIGAISKENRKIVDYFKTRFPWDYFFPGVGSKLNILKNLVESKHCDRSELAFMGDSYADVEAIQYVGFSICPANAIPEIRNTAKLLLLKNGGDGAIAELYGRIFSESSEILPHEV